MKLIALPLLLGLLISFADTIAPGPARSSTTFTLYGHVYQAMPAAQSPAQAQTPVQMAATLTIKLRVLKERGEEIKITYLDRERNFRYSDLSAGSYRLEISFGKQALYERELKVESDLFLAAPVGLNKVDAVSIEERTSKFLPGAEFQNKVKITVGAVDLRIGALPIVLRVTQVGATTSGSRRPTDITLASASLRSPRLISTFTFNNRKYTIAGLTRKSGGKEWFDCEVYR